MTNHYTFRPKKHLGQHFLSDASVLEQIIGLISPDASDLMIEIGPGPGILTEPLVSQVARLDLIEVDRDWVQVLRDRYAAYDTVRITHQDVLTIDWQNWAGEQKWRVVGNLPYNISTPLLFHLFAKINLFTDMHFLLQNEVVRRLAAPVDSTHYSRLSVMAQYYCEAKSLLFVPPHAFSPPPKVDSALIRLTPVTHPFQAKDINLFSTVVKEAFTYRRKTLSNALKKLISSEQLISLGVNPKLRPQNITVEQYVIIANALFQDD